MVSLSLFTLEQKIRKLSDDPHAGMMVYHFYIQRNASGVMVFDSRTKGIWEFTSPTAAARFVVERILKASGYGSLEIVG